MTDNPLVSIIVRTKDRPKLLRRALQSIAAQTYRPIEVVLVNDGGCELDSDSLRGILGDVSLNYIFLEKNTGRAHAGNVGIENARGSYVGFLDDDDELYPGHIETLVTFLEESDYRVAYTDTEMIFQEVKPGGEEMVDVGRTLFSKDFSYKDLLVGNYIPFNALLFYREVLSSAGSLDERFQLYEDWDLLIRIGEHHSFHHIGKITARYNQWSRDLQINRFDIEGMKGMYMQIIDKHREKITAEIIVNLVYDREKISDELKEKRIDLTAILEKKDGQISDLERAVRESDRWISDLESAVRKRDVQISHLEDTISTMRNTLGWQMLDGFRRMREKTFPGHTGRRKVFDLFMKSLKIIKNEGYEVFFKKSQAKIKTKFFSSKISSNISEIKGIRHFITPRRFKVLFLLSPWAGVTNRYRGYNMKEYLGLVGITSEIIGIEEIDARLSWALRFDIVVVHRVPMNNILDAFIKKCNELRIPVVFDLDDYIFDVSLLDRIDEIRRMNPSDRNKWVRHVRECGNTLDACDYFVGTTEYLADKVRKLGKKAFVIRNGLNETQVNESSRALREITRDPAVIKIGYFSGTKTHQKDFEVVSSALVRILEEYNNVMLSIGGFLELDHRFNAFSTRVERLPYVDWKELPFNIAKVDINMAPLEPDNPFCEAKSELKYFEAALLKIPTIASPTEAYKWAIRSGENGLLASTEEEWYRSLKVLIENLSLRKTLGEKAYEMVVKTYTPHVQAQNVLRIYEHIIMDYRGKTGISEESLSLSFLFSSFKKNNSFYKTLSVARHLAERGHFVRIYLDTRDSEEMREIKGLMLSDSPCDVHFSIDDILSCDALIAGNRESIASASGHIDICKKLFYVGDDRLYQFGAQSAPAALPRNDAEVELLEKYLRDELVARISQ